MALQLIIHNVLVGEVRMICFIWHFNGDPPAECPSDIVFWLKCVGYRDRGSIALQYSFGDGVHIGEDPFLEYSLHTSHWINHSRLYIIGRQRPTCELWFRLWFLSHWAMEKGWLGNRPQPLALEYGEKGIQRALVPQQVHVSCPVIATDTYLVQSGVKSAEVKLAALRTLYCRWWGWSAEYACWSQKWGDHCRIMQNIRKRNRITLRKNLELLPVHRATSSFVQQCFEEDPVRNGYFPRSLSRMLSHEVCTTKVKTRYYLLALDCLRCNLLI